MSYILKRPKSKWTEICRALSPVSSFGEKGRKCFHFISRPFQNFKYGSKVLFLAVMALIRIHQYTYEFGRYMLSLTQQQIAKRKLYNIRVNCLRNIG